MVSAINCWTAATRRTSWGVQPTNLQVGLDPASPGQSDNSGASLYPQTMLDCRYASHFMVSPTTHLRLDGITIRSNPNYVHWHKTLTEYDDAI